MKHPEQQYLDILQDILDNGEEVPNRTGVNTKRVLGQQMRFDFRDGFPLFTTKRVWFKGVAHELLWFLSGDTNIKYLVDNGVGIWNDDAYRYYREQFKLRTGEETAMNKEAFVESIKEEDFDIAGDLGPVYGAQWRNWHRREYGDGFITIDQVANLIYGLKNNPYSRRHIINAWNVGEIDKCALPPCHVLSQFSIFNGRLWCQMFQRSGDCFLGIPFNVASYSLLTYMIAQVCELEPGGFIWNGHDVHLYINHEDAAREQLSREPKDFPRLVLDPAIKDIDDFKFEHIKIEDYEPHTTIKAPLNT